MRVLYTVFVSIGLCSSGPERLRKLDPSAPSFHLKPCNGSPMTGCGATDRLRKLDPSAPSFHLKPCNGSPMTGCGATDRPRKLTIPSAHNTYDLETPMGRSAMTGETFSQSTSGAIGTQLKVSNIPQSIKEEDLFEMFSPFGQIKLIRIPISSRRAYFGFVHFATYDAAQRAQAAMDGYQFPQGQFPQRQELRVSFAAIKDSQSQAVTPPRFGAIGSDTEFHQIEDCSHPYVPHMPPYPSMEGCMPYFVGQAYDPSMDCMQYHGHCHNLESRMSPPMIGSSRETDLSYVSPSLRSRADTPPRFYADGRFDLESQQIENSFQPYAHHMSIHPPIPPMEGMPYFVGQAYDPSMDCMQYHGHSQTQQSMESMQSFGQASGQPSSSLGDDDLWKIDDLVDEDDDDILRQQSHAPPTINPQETMTTTSFVQTKETRRVKDLSDDRDDDKTKLIRSLEKYTRKENHSACIESLPLVFLEHRLFELAKIGDFYEIRRIEKWLFQAYSKYRGQVFTSAYRRLLNDSYEFPKELMNKHKDGITKMQEHYTRREVRKTTFKLTLNRIFSETHPKVSIEEQGAPLERELYEMALRNQWKELQYALDIFHEAQIGKGIMQQLFNRVHQIVNQ